MDSRQLSSTIKDHWSLPYIALVSTYGLLRVMFQQWESSKQAFIYPVGHIIQSYYGQGFYTGEQWLFDVAGVPFTLSTQYSGTTFFSLITAFLVFKGMQHKRFLLLVLMAYPVTLIANAIRVSSLFYTHKLLDDLNLTQFNDIAHVLVGTVSFLSVFLLFIWLFELHHQPSPKDAHHDQPRL